MTNDVDLDALVLERGKHDRREDGMDIMEAVAWFAGEEHSDHPKCASGVIAAGMIGVTAVSAMAPPSA